MPLDALSTFYVKLSDTYVACGGKHYVAKAESRLGSFTGLFDLIFVYFWSLITQDELFYTWADVF